MTVSVSRVLLFAAAMLAAAAVPQAAPESVPQAAPESVPESILERLRQARPDLRFGNVSPSPMPGIYQVQLQQGPAIYLSEDGQYFLTGDMYEVRKNELVNLAEVERQGERRELLSQVRESDMIVFSPVGTLKGTVTVFTDVDCFYCQKLHKEVPELNRLGIKVRYLAYPRAGLDSESYRKIATAWCAENPQDAITRLKARESLPENVCSQNPVAAHFQLGQQVGVTGTPALLLDDGTLVSGYMPAQQLVERMGAS